MEENTQDAVVEAVEEAATPAPTPTSAPRPSAAYADPEPELNAVVKAPEPAPAAAPASTGGDGGAADPAAAAAAAGGAGGDATAAHNGASEDTPAVAPAPIEQAAPATTYGGSGSGYGGADEVARKVFVGGIAWTTTNEGLGAYFSQFGTVENAHVVTDRNTGQSRGFAFVTFGAESCKSLSFASAIDFTPIHPPIISVHHCCFVPLILLAACPSAKPFLLLPCTCSVF